MHPHCCTDENDTYRCCGGTHRAVLAHPYNMSNHRQVTLPAGTGYPGPVPTTFELRGGGGGGGGGSGGSSNSNSNNTGMDGHPDEMSGQRKRIAVACGRCRKRKIRCSGDAGTGEPCTNCRSSGYHPCQFLRVQSHDAGSFKDQGFSYNLETSRQFQARGAAASTYGSNIAGPSTMTTPYPDGIPSHPAASASGTNGNANTPAPAHHMEGMPYRNGSAYTYGPASAPRTGFVWNGLPASESTSGYPNPAAPEGQAGYQAGGSGSTSNGGTSAYGANGAYTHQGPYASSVPYAVHEPRYPFTAYHAAYHAYTGQLPPLPSTRATAMGVNGLENPSSYGYSNHLTAAVPSPHRAQNPSSEDIKPPVSSASTSSSVTLAGGAALSDRESHGSQTTIPVHQMHRNNSVSSMGSYGNRRSTASPATSLSTSHQEGTPSSSFDSYTTSPATTATGYPPAASSQRQSSSSGSNGMYTTSPAGSSNADFPPSSHGYVYTDTTAAAILAAAAHRRATPGNERNGNGTGSSNTYEASHSALAAGSYAMPAELSGDQRKAAMGP